MKHLKRIILLLMIVSIFKVTNVFAEDEYDTQTTYSGYDYIIDSYDVNIKVNENNTYDITENIVANFNVPKHGIFRKLPLHNTVQRLDGTTTKNRAQIRNLSVSDEYETSSEDGYYTIKIGDSDKTLTGKKAYTIKYRYNIGKDPLSDKDEFYYNIIGNEWDTQINGVTFTIDMPKSFDKSKLGFSLGTTGSTDNTGLTYKVEGNTITGSYAGTLAPKEALTARLELDEGYYVGAGYESCNLQFLMFLVPTIFFLISFFLWKKFGKDDPVVETVEFYPPQGYNSLEVGYYYKGHAGAKDVTSLLIYLANKGYIKITECKTKGILGDKDDFKITKLKEYDGKNNNEAIFLQGLFEPKPTLTSIFGNNQTQSNLTEVTSADLEENFYRTMNKITDATNNGQMKQQIFVKGNFAKSLLVVLMIIISMVLIIGIPTYDYGTMDDVGISIFVSLFFIPFIAVAFSKDMPAFARVIWVGALSLFAFIFLGNMPIGEALKDGILYSSGFIVGLVSIIGMCACLMFMSKRTAFGNEILGKLKGFKNFLQTAEKDKLEAMVMENPTYFYDILPFTYVLGVSDKWIKKFETIAMQPPTWYDSPNGFNVITFNNFMDRTMSSAQNAMASAPSSSSSGGGFSGGGSGGGGGGSW